MGVVGKRYGKFTAAIFIRLGPSTLEQLTARAAQTGKPVAELARSAIEAYLSQQDAKAAS